MTALPLGIPARRKRTRCWSSFPAKHSYAERAAATEELRDLPRPANEHRRPGGGRGDKVGFRFTATGTSSGPFLGLKPSNEVLNWPGIAVYRTAGGKVAEEWILWSLDNLYYEIER